MTLYLSDLDGTLLDENAQVTPETANCLNRAIAAGAGFSIATARTPASVVEILKEVDCRLPIIVMNGAGLYDLASGCYRQLIQMPETNVKELLHLLRQEQMTGFCYTENSGCLDVYYDYFANDAQRRFAEARHDLATKRYIQGEYPGGKAIFYSIIDNEEKTVHLMQRLHQMNGISVHRYQDSYDKEAWIIEIYRDGISKKSGADWLRAQSGADELVAFGDNENDRMLFAAADRSYAVAHAVEGLKKQATAVLKDSSSEAVGRFILSDYLGFKG